MGESFVDKYRPESLEEIKGNNSAVDDIREWAATWTKGDPPLLLHGEAGTGKTSTAEALAKDFDWATVEINASSARTTDDIKSMAQQLRSDTYTGRRQLFIIDEIDSFGRGITITPLKKVIDDAPQPIIFICNEKWKVPDGIENACDIHKFKLRKDSIKPVLRWIAEEEDIDISSRKLGQLSTRNGLRDAINDLQRFAESSEDIGWDERDQDIGNFKAVDNILRGKKFTGEMSPPDLVDWLEENIQGEFRGVELLRAYQALSEADKWLQKTNETQDYSWWRYAGTIAEEVAEMRITEPYDWISKSYPQSRRQYTPKATDDSPVSILYRELKEYDVPNFKAGFGFHEFRKTILPMLKSLDEEEKMQLILSEGLSQDAMEALDVSKSEYDDWLMDENVERNTEITEYEEEEQDEEMTSIFEY